MVLFVVPLFISPVIVGTFFSLILTRPFGPTNYLLGKLLGHTVNIDFTIDQKWPYFSILLADARPEKGAGWTDWVTAGLTPKFAFLLLLLLMAADAGRVWGMDGSLSKRRRPAARLS